MANGISAGGAASSGDRERYSDEEKAQTVKKSSNLKQRATQCEKSH